MGEVLEFGEIEIDLVGNMVPGRLKLTEQNIVFKITSTGKVDQIAVDDVKQIQSEKSADVWVLRVLTKQHDLHRFRGFQDQDMKKISKFLLLVYEIKLEEKELSVKGFNWGISRFDESVLNIDDRYNKNMFEVPLKNVSQCLTGKNEVTLEFHQNDDDSHAQLKKMRFFISSTEQPETTDPVERFQRRVMSKASVISATGEAIAIFRKIHCLTPRSRYDMKIFSSFFQLHGKTFDYTIPMQSVLRLFLVPHKDKRQMFFVLSLHPPITQGQTRYHFLVLLFGLDEEITIELPFTQQELKEKYNKEIGKELSGPVYEVFGKVMTVLVGRKITGAGNFVGHSGTAAIGCSFKAAAGYLYPLESGFLYVHKPPIHIRFEEISSVNFARSGGNTRSFDLEVTLENGSLHIFSSIEKEEYNKLYAFIQKKNLNCSNIGKQGARSNEETVEDSENENEPDSYLARIKADECENDSNGDESTDEDFVPNEAESEVDEEYDSDIQTDSSDDSEENYSNASSDDDSDSNQNKSTQKAEKKENPRKQMQEDKNRNKISPKKSDTTKIRKDLKANSNVEHMETKKRKITTDSVNKKTATKRKLEKTSSRTCSVTSASAAVKSNSKDDKCESEASLSESVEKKLKV